MTVRLEIEAETFSELLGQLAVAYSAYFLAPPVAIAHLFDRKPLEQEAPPFTSLGGAPPAQGTPPASSATTTPAPAPITFEDVHRAYNAYAERCGRRAALALLRRCGFHWLSDVRPEDYEFLHAAILRGVQ